MDARSARLTAALVGAALVVVHGVVVWRGTERRVLQAAEAEARAVHDAVSAGVRSNIEAGAELERLLSRRLRDVAQTVARRAADAPGREEHVLTQAVRDHGLRGGFVTSADGAVRAVAVPMSAARTGDGGTGPADPARIARVESEVLARGLLERGLTQDGSATAGFGESAFGRRAEYLVAVAMPGGDGFVVLRERATELEQLRRTAGIEPLLAQTAAGPAVAYVAVTDARGEALAVGGLAADETLPPRPADGLWTTTAGGRAVLDVARPAEWPGAAGEQLRVGLEGAPVRGLVAATRRSTVLLATLLLGGGALALWLLRRLERSAAAREAELAERLARRERFAALGRMAADVAHEVRGPLNAVSMAAQRLGREARPDEPAKQAKFTELHGALRSGVARVNGTVEDFLAFGRGPRPAEPRDVVLASLAADVADREHPAARMHGDPRLTVRTDPVLLSRAIANLLRNAAAVAPAGSIEVSWRRGSDGVEVYVDDGGPGVPEADRERVFEPFESARPGGTGLGLSIARAAVERLGGRVSVRDAPRGGARFAIVLPDTVVPPEVNG